MTSLSQKVILVTGANGGFGQQFVKQFLEQGAYLVLTDINQEALEKSVEKIMQSIPNCKGKVLSIFGADLSTKQGCEEVFKTALSGSQKVDILINNAGMINYGSFHEIPAEKWEKLIDVNVLSLMRLSHHFMKYFADKKQGHILNISSVSGFIPTGHGVPYSTSKFAVRGFGLGLHQEAKKLGVKITNVYPFYSPTPLLNTATDGSSKTGTLPKFLYDSPELIVKAAIKGLRKGKLNVYPGWLPRLLFNVNKIFPIPAYLGK